MKTTFLILSFSFLSLFASVEQSILPLMDQSIIKDLNGKINSDQRAKMENSISCLDQRLRVMSFNMLLNYSESHLDVCDRWAHRKARVIEYLQWSYADVIGSQELQADQLEDILTGIGERYAYYGIGAEDGLDMGDIPAIFYRKDRLELLLGKTYYFSETPEEISEGPFGSKNTFTFCHFRDKKTCHEFIVLNTHLAFGNIERRSYEAEKLRDFLLGHYFKIPVLLTGDFNTFPFRQQLDLPFYDGDEIVSTIEEAGVRDSLKLALFGHFGPVSSTNFCSKKKKPFRSRGTPGVILDHVFVGKGVYVLCHGIDPAQVDHHFPSDHFPVVVDCLIHSSTQRR